MLIEPVAVPEVYIDGIASIEQRGSNLKFAFYSLQKPYTGEAHALDAVIVARVVMPVHAVATASLQAMAATETAVSIDPTH